MAKSDSIKQIKAFLGEVPPEGFKTGTEEDENYKSVSKNDGGVSIKLVKPHSFGRRIVDIALKGEDLTLAELHDRVKVPDSSETILLAEFVGVSTDLKATAIRDMLAVVSLAASSQNRELAATSSTQ